MLNRQNAHALSKGVVDVGGTVATGQVVLMGFVVHSSPLEEFMYIMSMSMFMYHVLRLCVQNPHFHLNALEGQIYPRSMGSQELIDVHERVEIFREWEGRVSVSGSSAWSSRQVSFHNFALRN